LKTSLFFPILNETRSSLSRYEEDHDNDLGWLVEWLSRRKDNVRSSAHRVLLWKVASFRFNL